MRARELGDLPPSVLVTGWFSFVDGEATAGDVGAAEAVCAGLEEAGITYETAWSPRFRPGGLALEEAVDRGHTALVFVCGPLAGEQVRGLHRLFGHCRRVAVGVSVLDPDDAAARGFHTILQRDTRGLDARRDLAPGAPPPGRSVPVVGVVRAPGQPEYGQRSAHTEVHRRLGRWLAGRDCARFPLDTRLDAQDWLHCSDTAQFDALVSRTDLVVTTRLHGLVLALRNGVPALAVDPVAGGAKVAAQGRAWDWPVITVDGSEHGPDPGALDRLWRWCRTGGPEAARARAAAPAPSLVSGLTAALEPVLALR